MKIILSIFLAAICSTVSFSQTSEINIIPKPASVVRKDGNFIVDRSTRIVLENQDDMKLAKLLNAYLQSNFGFELKTAAMASKKPAIIFSRPDDYAIVNDGYVITNQNQHLFLEAATPAGRFYALQSLLQLVQKSGDQIVIPNATINDSARFRYRGMHLDVSRHFFPVEFVKRYIDLMAQYKFNYFHWHLTDDQGWRIEIKKYPKLTEIGSKRPESVLGRNLQPYVGDKTPVEGFYTQDQIRDVVAYAKARYITVIPEIEIPGHSSAALAAYPELGCRADHQYKVQTTWGIFKEVYCPNEKTFQFLQGVIDEVIALFPDSPYVHIGGDEVLKDMWKDSPETQELMKRENLKDLNEVQSYIVQRMEKYINSKGKKIIGWDEILEGGLAPNATVMSWRGIKGGIEAAKAHHEVIMTPTDFAYLDYGQGDPSTEPLNIGNYLPLEKVYSFDPVPKELSPDEAKYILGGQGNIWTEYMADPAKVEYMAFPRMLAIAEDVWTMPENKNYADFLRGLPAQFARLDTENVNYRIPEPSGLQNMVVGSNGTATVEMTPSIPGAKIYYTLDGSTPSETSTFYTRPIDIGADQPQRVDVKTITVLTNGRKSSVYVGTILRRDYIAPTDLKDPRAGVTFALVSASQDSRVLRSGETRAVGLQQPMLTPLLKQSFEVGFDGYIKIPADGVYEFQLESNWDGSVTVDDDTVTISKGSKDREMKSTVVPLKAGFHKIAFRYRSGGDTPVFRIRWGIKGQGLRAIGGAELAH